MPLTEIFRSPHRAACEHRAFVLRAVGIGSEIYSEGTDFVLFVPTGAIDWAREQLALYERENKNSLPTAPTFTSLPSAWLAPLLFAVSVLTVAFLAGREAFGFDWYRAGALPGTLTQTHEWWRIGTALFLHADHQHLVTNLGFGAAFLLVAARLVGFGVTLFATTLASLLGNGLDSLLVPATHLSIGASTLVFATLGLVAAYSWRVEMSSRAQWAHRASPLVAGVMLLGFIGSGGENTDVLAHLTGFFFGACLGAALALAPPRLWQRTSMQWSGALCALAIWASAWICALLHST